MFNFACYTVCNGVSGHVPWVDMRVGVAMSFTPTAKIFNLRKPVSVNPQKVLRHDCYTISQIKVDMFAYST